METDWPVYSLSYLDENGGKAAMEVPMTFADFAVTEGRFRKQFRTAPRDAWNENMMPLSEYLELAEEEREGRFPYIWAVNPKKQLIRVIPALPIVRSCEDRRNFWRMLKSLANVQEPAAAVTVQPAEQVRADFARALAARVSELARPAVAVEKSVVPRVAAAAPVPLAVPAAPPASAPVQASSGDGYVAPWIESANCTSCDECIGINPKIFAYDSNKHAYVKNPKGGPYKDLVRAAEKCTAQIIHPGTPADPNEKDVDKLLKRAAKYN
jgi:pyruvate-ferredoxin/flavodoxin oxidoreductase